MIDDWRASVNGPKHATKYFTSYLYAISCYNVFTIIILIRSEDSLMTALTTSCFLHDSVYMPEPRAEMAHSWAVKVFIILIITVFFFELLFKEYYISVFHCVTWLQIFQSLSSRSHTDFTHQWNLQTLTFLLVICGTLVRQFKFTLVEFLCSFIVPTPNVLKSYRLSVARLYLIKGTQRRFPPTYIENTF